jgi:hypothetical protein
MAGGDEDGVGDGLDHIPVFLIGSSATCLMMTHSFGPVVPSVAHSFWL